jgi:histidine triad (HIT) family protein
VDCLFCKLVAGEIPADVVHQDEDTLAFRDIRPMAPHHVLVIPKRHIESLAHVTDSTMPLVTACLATVGSVARQAGLDREGYRVVANVGTNGGQTVNHLHWHVLGGRPMAWPPG